MSEPSCQSAKQYGVKINTGVVSILTFLEVGSSLSSFYSPQNYKRKYYQKEPILKKNSKTHQIVTSNTVLCQLT